MKKESISLIAKYEAVVLLVIIVLNYVIMPLAATSVPASTTITNTSVQAGNNGNVNGTLYDLNNRVLTVLNNTTEPASYIVFQKGATPTYYVKNATTGLIDYSGTNGTTVIQNAINHLPTTTVQGISMYGGIILFQPGEYIVRALTLPDKLNANVKLIGSGRDVTRITGSSTTAQNAIVTSLSTSFSGSSRHITIADMIIYSQQGTNPYTFLLDLFYWNIHFERMAWQGSIVSGNQLMRAGGAGAPGTPSSIRDSSCTIMSASNNNLCAQLWYEDLTLYDFTCVFNVTGKSCLDMTGTHVSLLGTNEVFFCSACAANTQLYTVETNTNVNINGIVLLTQTGTLPTYKVFKVVGTGHLTVQADYHNDFETSFSNVYANMFFDANTKANTDFYGKLERKSAGTLVVQTLNPTLTSALIDISTAGNKTGSIPHGLPYTPSPKDLELSFNTTDTRVQFSSLSVTSVDATNINYRVFVSTAGNTGATGTVMAIVIKHDNWT